MESWVIGVFGSESTQCRCGFACNEPKFAADEQVKQLAITEKIAFAANSPEQTFWFVGDHISRGGALHPSPSFAWWYILWPKGNSISISSLEQCYPHFT